MLQFLRNWHPIVALLVAASIVGIGIVGFELPEGGGRREILLAGALIAGTLTFLALKPKKVE